MSILSAVYSRWSGANAKQRFMALAVSGGVGALFVSVLTVSVFAQHQRIRKLTAVQDDLIAQVEQTVEAVEGIEEDGKSAVVSQELRQLREEVIKYRAEQQGRDQILGLSTGLGLPTLSDPLESLSNTLSSLEESATGSSQTLPSSTPSTTTYSTPQQSGSHLGTVTLLEGKSWTSVDVFEQPVSSSKIVGQLVIRVSYPYYTKQNGWYQAELSNGKRGWVQEQFVKEE